MTERMDAAPYHLSKDGEEDRLMIAADAAPDRRPMVAVPLVVRTIRLQPQPHTRVIVAFDDAQRMISIEMSTQRLHRFTVGVLNFVADAGRNLPRIAMWLDRASVEAAPSPKVSQ
jgi:hypothetical protein